MSKLVNIDDIQASEYNPRQNDEKRLALTELSLRKLGFLLPIYATKSGEILSGHQRHLVAKRMGFKMVPVEYVTEMTLDKRKSVNILFNRATNDLDKQDNCEKIKKQLYETDIDSMSTDLPDIDVESDEAFPCINALRRIDTLQLAKNNHREFDKVTSAVSKALIKEIDSVMPIVITHDMRVINGIGRLQTQVEGKAKFVQCVIVKPEQEELARTMLNLLSMDFKIDNEYADMLRYNSFMRERHQRAVVPGGEYGIGDGFYKGLFPNNIGRDFTILEGDVKKAWIKHYGEHIVDFGAGKLSNTIILRKSGIQCSAFEPYFVTSGDVIHKEKSLEIAERFLDEVESGIEYSTVFISSVFNSVPFIEDRKMIAIIAAALVYPKGQVVCWCQSSDSSQFRSVKHNNLSDDAKLVFDIGYEQNTVIGDLTRHPKVQKGHTEAEMHEIFLPCFARIKRCEQLNPGKFWYLEADGAIVNAEALAKALDFEFDLPYPDGTRAGMNKRAREVFSKRLGMRLPEQKGGLDE